MLWAFANEWLAARPDIETGTNGQDDATARIIGTAEFSWRGITLKTGVMPYRFYLLQRLQDSVAEANAGEQQAIGDLFTETGLASMLDIKTIRRVERLNHLEVWGPLLEAASNT